MDKDFYNPPSLKKQGTKLGGKPLRTSASGDAGLRGLWHFEPDSFAAKLFAFLEPPSSLIELERSGGMVNVKIGSGMSAIR